MMLRELEGQLMKRSDNGNAQDVESVAEADFLQLLCPGCFALNGGAVGTHRVNLPFNKWSPEGTTLDDLTFVPRKVGGTSVLIHPGSDEQWHGWILDGQAIPWQPGD